MQHAPDKGPEEEKYRRIVERIVAGEASGQEALYELFGRGARFYIAYQLRGEDVEDKVHDTFLAVITAIRDGHLQNPARLPGFVRTILQRQVTGHISESRRRHVESLDAFPQMPFSRQGLDPEQEAIQRQRRDLAQRILQTLPEIDRQILRRFYFEGQSPGQICEDLKITETQFRLRKHRAKQRFVELTREAMKKKKPAGEVLLRKKAAAGH